MFRILFISGIISCVASVIVGLLFSDKLLSVLGIALLGCIVILKIFVLKSKKLKRLLPGRILDKLVIMILTSIVLFYIGGFSWLQLVPAIYTLYRYTISVKEFELKTDFSHLIVKQDRATVLNKKKKRTLEESNVFI